MSASDIHVPPKTPTCVSSQSCHFSRESPPSLPQYHRRHRPFRRLCHHDGIDVALHKVHRHAIPEARPPCVGASEEEGAGGHSSQRSSTAARHVPAARAIAALLRCPSVRSGRHATIAAALCRLLLHLRQASIIHRQPQQRLHVHRVIDARPIAVLVREALIRRCPVIVWSIASTKLDGSHRRGDDEHDL